MKLAFFVSTLILYILFRENDNNRKIVMNELLNIFHNGQKLNISLKNMAAAKKIRCIKIGGNKSSANATEHTLLPHYSPMCLCCSANGALK